MHRAHKVKLDPTKCQKEYFEKASGVARHSYNWALAQWKRQYEAGGNPSEMSLRKQYNAIKHVEFPWATEVTKLRWVDDDYARVDHCINGFLGLTGRLFLNWIPRRCPRSPTN